MFILTAKLSPTKLLAISLAVVTLVLGVVFLALPKEESVETAASMKIKQNDIFEPKKKSTFHRLDYDFLEVWIQFCCC